MSSHCHCPPEDRDAVRRETEITHGAPEGTVSIRDECLNCGGLIEVIR